MTRWLWLSAILLLMGLVLYSPATFAGDLTVTWITQPGDQKAKEVVVWGGDATGPNDDRALRGTVTADANSYQFAGAAIAKAFPGTDHLCYSARNLGDTKWWTDITGTPPCKGPDWVKTLLTDFTIPPPVIIDPGITAVENLKAIMVGALDKCLKKPVMSREKCLAGIRDALKKETK